MTQDVAATCFVSVCQEKRKIRDTTPRGPLGASQDAPWTALWGWPGRRREVQVLWEGAAAAGAEAGQAVPLWAPEEESGTRRSANETHRRGLGTGGGQAVPCKGTAPLRTNGECIRDRRMRDNEINDENRESPCGWNNGRPRGGERGCKGAPQSQPGTSRALG